MKLWVKLVIAALVILFALTVYPTPYVYWQERGHNDYPPSDFTRTMRRNRFTGQIETVAY